MFLCVRERERERDLLQNNHIKRFNLELPPSLYMLILVLHAFDSKYPVLVVPFTLQSVLKVCFIKLALI